MLKNFPLSPKIWLDWIKTEISLLASDDTEGGVQRIKSLFDQAVADYTSFDVWLEYVQWACGTGDTSMVPNSLYLIY